MKNLIIILNLFLIISCGSRKNLNFQNVNETTKSLDGIFENSNNNLIQLLDRKLMKDTLAFADLKQYNKFSIETINNKLRITLISENSSNITRDYKFKKENNIYYLKNKNVKPLLIPYLAGAIDEKRLYFYINKRNDLEINVYQSRSGALLFVAFLDWKQTQKSYSYKRIE